MRENIHSSAQLPPPTDRSPIMTTKHFMLKLYVVILLILNFLLFNSVLFAQKGYMFGVQLGPNITVGSLSHLSSPSPDFGMRPNYGLSGGFVFHYGFKYGFYKNISIRSGMLINYKRYDIFLEDGIVNFQRQIFDVPIEFPILLSVRTPLSEHSYLRQFMGLSINYIKQVSDEYTEADTIADEFSWVHYSLSYTSYVLNGFTACFVAGVAYEIETYRGHLVNIGLSYNRGLRPEMVGELRYTLSNPENNFNKSYVHALLYNGSYLSFNLSIYFREPKGCWMCWFW